MVGLALSFQCSPNQFENITLEQLVQYQRALARHDKKMVESMKQGGGGGTSSDGGGQITDPQEIRNFLQHMGVKQNESVDG